MTRRTAGRLCLGCEPWPERAIAGISARAKTGTPITEGYDRPGIAAIRLQIAPRQAKAVPVPVRHWRAAFLKTRARPSACSPEAGRATPFTPCFPRYRLSKAGCFGRLQRRKGPPRRPCGSFDAGTRRFARGAATFGPLPTCPCLECGPHLLNERYEKSRCKRQRKLPRVRSPIWRGT